MGLKVLAIALLVALALLATFDAGPMYYKKVSGQKYEPDWVPVSSTVIPLAEYRVSVGGGGEQGSLLTGDEYRRAYLRHQQLSAAAKNGKDKLKTVPGKGSEAEAGAAARVQEDPDTLITAKKKFYERKSN
ncbi:AAEL005287-PA [Aedes aegypti]|uniref:AAEL005287-PA n=2 Tax=Aedes aegypti TaxID=7159 RepID=Q17AI8_AEDAE|nr:uncharacterized protein LOC110676630 [Aedes aegypti]EAT43264.1 AAEL005287-PA [Aedes aegypti]